LDIHQLSLAPESDFRDFVMQEALSNVAKHSQASHVFLSLIKNDHRLEFFIKDHGIGFDPEEAIVKRSVGRPNTPEHEGANRTLRWNLWG
jgi:glucose-6-phosphate-specific signal transduction histidine kinase